MVESPTVDRRAALLRTEAQPPETGGDGADESKGTSSFFVADRHARIS